MIQLQLLLAHSALSWHVTPLSKPEAPDPEKHVPKVQGFVPCVRMDLIASLSNLIGNESKFIYVI